MSGLEYRIMLQQWIYVFLLMFGHSLSANIRVSRDAALNEFIILHNNDMHARFEQTSRNGGVCSRYDTSKDKCFGGIARVAHEVRRHREEAKNGGTPVLYLNAGDTYSGTAWFTLFRENITSAFLNKLQPDAMSLGNHEFDETIQSVVPFLNALSFPVLVSNMDMTNEPELLATNKLSNSTVLNVNGVKVGIIGYLTNQTKDDAHINVEFKDEVESINTEATKLKDKGINIIIALGHSGYQKDLEIARDCPEVDIVIGGHSHTFLDSSQPVADIADTNPEAVRGPYPTTVTQSSGKKVPVVQAYAYTKYLGKLKVQFDGDGNLVSFDGSPILLNASIAQEQDVLDLLDAYRPAIAAIGERIIGFTKVDLEGGKVCRQRECNLGNLITDSMVYARVLENKGGDYWTDAAVALMGGGGIRGPIDKNAEGSITLRDIMDVLPFTNRLVLTRISGQTLRNALERAATLWSTDASGGFLQLSGIHVEYDFERGSGQRVVSASVLCAQCRIPSYSALNETDFYNIITTDFVLSGGDGFELLEKENPHTEVLHKGDIEALQQYLQRAPIVFPHLEERIVFKIATNTE
ncbi:protein 5NUC-like [Drosophila nasuta]|uniref:protein 5NUC-like n=1 Tax=Drosophila nasuta TaxID=42062 RepID=UPI00295EE7AB|nr:protein 5NUC-like [Drosophila nasuta]